MRSNKLNGGREPAIHTISTRNRFPTAFAYFRSVSTEGDTRPPSSRAIAVCVVPIRSAKACCVNPHPPLSRIIHNQPLARILNKPLI